MKNKTLIIAALMTVWLLGCGMHAFGATINDVYFGGGGTHGYTENDVIGSADYYDTLNMDVSFTNTKMNVDIYSTFAAQIGSSVIWDEKSKLGDLFIGTGGWRPDTSAPDYKNDTYLTTCTQWNYVARITPHNLPAIQGDTTRNGQVELYATKDGAVILSNLEGLNPDEYGYRENQAFQFQPNAGVTPVSTGTWSITDVPGSIYARLNISIDYTALIGTGDIWAYHWTMSCGNDVIEGETAVTTPEPSTALLFAAGLFGVLMLRRNSRKHL